MQHKQKVINIDGDIVRGQHRKNIEKRPSRNKAT